MFKYFADSNESCSRLQTLCFDPREYFLSSYDFSPYILIFELSYEGIEIPASRTKPDLDLKIDVEFTIFCVMNGIFT